MDNVSQHTRSSLVALLQCGLALANEPIIISLLNSAPFAISFSCDNMEHVIISVPSLMVLRQFNLVQ